MPGGRSPGPEPATPAPEAPEAPAGEGGESREAKPLWKLRCRRVRGQDRRSMASKTRQFQRAALEVACT